MEKPSYQILYFNGSSSSGKTTLCKHLQETLNEPFLHIGIDKVISMMPGKLNDWMGSKKVEGYSWKKSKDEEGHLIQEIQMGPFAYEIEKAYREIVLTLSKLGYYLLIDDVCFGKEMVDRWKNLLKNFKVFYIGVLCPIDEIEKREGMRNDRILGSGRAQSKKVHIGVEYDLTVDTHLESKEEICKKIFKELY